MFDRRLLICCVLVACWAADVALPIRNVNAETVEIRPPNIVLILADDLGYGDIQCLNPDKGKIATPAIDRLAQQGFVLLTRIRHLRFALRRVTAF